MRGRVAPLRAPVEQRHGHHQDPEAHEATNDVGGETLAGARIHGTRRCRRRLVRQCIERDELQNDHEKVGHRHPLRSGNEHHPSTSARSELGERRNQTPDRAPPCLRRSERRRSSSASDDEVGGDQARSARSELGERRNVIDLGTDAWWRGRLEVARCAPSGRRP